MRRPIRITLLAAGTIALAACSASPFGPASRTCTQQNSTSCSTSDFVNPAGDFVNPAGDFINPAGDFVNPAGDFVNPAGAVVTN